MGETLLDNAINIFFNDVQIPSFVKVTDISYSMLPNLDASRDRTLFNERTITVSFVFLFNKIRSLAEINKFNEWLRGNNFVFHSSTENETSDTAKTINTYFCHNS